MPLNKEAKPIRKKQYLPLYFVIVIPLFLNCIFDQMLMNLRGAFNRFPDFFVQAFKIVVDS